MCHQKGTQMPHSPPWQEDVWPLPNPKPDQIEVCRCSGSLAWMRRPSNSHLHIRVVILLLVCWLSPHAVLPIDLCIFMSVCVFVPGIYAPTHLLSDNCLRQAGGVMVGGWVAF